MAEARGRLDAEVEAIVVAKSSSKNKRIVQFSSENEGIVEFSSKGEGIVEFSSTNEGTVEFSSKNMGSINSIQENTAKVNENTPEVYSAPGFVIRLAAENSVNVKAVVNGIKTADLLLKGFKIVQAVMILMSAQGSAVALGSTPDGLFLSFKAAKVFMKGLKMSQKALGATSFGSGSGFQKVLKNFSKVSFGALNVVGSGSSIVSQMDSGLVAMLNWKLLVKSYEASKGAVTAVEGLTSLKVGFVAAFGKGLLGLKGAIGGVGVMIKALVVSEELYLLLIKSIGLSHGAREVLRIVSRKRRSARLLEAAKVSNVKFPARKTFSSSSSTLHDEEFRVAVWKPLLAEGWKFSSGDAHSDALGLLLSVQGIV